MNKDYVDLIGFRRDSYELALRVMQGGEGEKSAIFDRWLGCSCVRVCVLFCVF